MGMFSIFSRGHAEDLKGPAGDTEDWKPGDQAECISLGPWFRVSSGASWPVPGPAQGEVRVVTAVGSWQPRHPQLSPVILQFARWPGEWWCANSFRKVTPRADEAVAGTAATIDELIGKPVRAPELVP